MNVFDFDKTIYDGNSTVDFFVYVLRRHPAILRHAPAMIAATMRYYLFKKGTKTAMKDRLYLFVNDIETEYEVAEFWKTHLRLKPFYRKMRREDDVIISASPAFLLVPLEESQHFRVLASLVSPIDGKTMGNNCYYDEKVRRLYEAFPDAEVEEFYSDSYSDEPLAKEAQRAFIVKKHKLIPWNFNRHKKHLHT